MAAADFSQENTEIEIEFEQIEMTEEEAKAQPLVLKLENLVWYLSKCSKPTFISKYTWPKRSPITGFFDERRSLKSKLS